MKVIRIADYYWQCRCGGLIGKQRGTCFFCGAVRSDCAPDPLYPTAPAPRLPSEREGR